MQRFTISLDDTLAGQFDAVIAAKGYVNRSEAVRDLIRNRIDSDYLQGSTAAWCVATLNYVYDHHDKTVIERVLSLQHDHHDLVITSLHTHLDHDNCLETVVLRGPIQTVSAFSQTVVALRGVRHGHVHIIPLQQDERIHQHAHSGDPTPKLKHLHLKPIS